MRALTLHQPWASLIAEGYKSAVTRNRPAPQSLVGGRIAIHAAKRRPRPSEWNGQVAEIAGRLELPLGAIVATARLKRCARVLSAGFASLDVRADPGKVWVLDRFGMEGTDACRMKSDPYGDYTEGRWIWELSGVWLVNPPIEARGRRGIWELPQDIALQLNRKRRNATERESRGR